MVAVPWVIWCLILLGYNLYMNIEFMDHNYFDLCQLYVGSDAGFKSLCDKDGIPAHFSFPYHLSATSHGGLVFQVPLDNIDIRKGEIVIATHFDANVHCL